MIPKFKNGKFEIKFHQHERTQMGKLAEMCRTISKMQPIDESMRACADTAANSLEQMLKPAEDKAE